MRLWIFVVAHHIYFGLFHQGLLKESERRKVDLSSLMETGAGLQTLVEGSEAQLEDRLCSLNDSWGRVRTWTEDWLSAVLVRTKIPLKKSYYYYFCK